MRKVLLFFFSLLFINGLVAQKQKVNYLTTFDDKRLHFGFTLGLNYLDFNVRNYEYIGLNPDLNLKYIDELPDKVNQKIYCDIPALIPGFTVGIISNLRAGRNLDLRFLPGLSFGERKLYYNVDVIDVYNREPSNYYSIKSTFLDFPLLFKYKAKRINNGRPYVIFGPAARLDISKTALEDLVKLTKTGFYAEIGGGWDQYFTFFRFSVEGKFSFGLNNQLGNIPGGTSQRLYYSQSIKSLRSNIFTILFHFE